MGDEVMAVYAFRFILFLLILSGVKSLIGFISQPQINDVFNSIIRTLDGLVGVIQWVISTAALFYIGLMIKNTAKKE
jgi:hypothetical protein